MSRKSLTFLLLTAASIGTGGAHAAPPRVPLGNAIIKTDENAAKNPQAPGPRNANEKQRANQARFVDKHFGPDAPQRVEKVERVERAERPERVERAERPERVERVERVERAERVERVERAQRPERVERFERPGMGKGR